MGLLKETSYPKETMSIKTVKEDYDQDRCAMHHLAIADTMDILNGKWKFRIIGMLSFGPIRFLGLKNRVEGISAKMLSKELQDLETNGLITRTVKSTKPTTVEYELTSYGHSLKPIIDGIASWGMEHRKTTINRIKTKGS